jgi:hypothetical protein
MGNSIIGIDPGLTVTGLAIIHDERGVFTDKFSTKPHDLLPKRIHDTTGWLYHQIEDAVLRGYVPRVARVELLHGGYRAGTRARVLNFVDLRNLALLTGGIVDRIMGWGFPVEFVEPSIMRIAGKPVRRDVKKKIAVEIVRARYGSKVSDHEADAVLLAAPATTAEIAAAWAGLTPSAHGGRL